MTITIIKKRMKNMRITIAPDGVVVVSAPKRVSKAQIDHFIDSRKPRIDKVQDKFQKARDLIKLQNGEILLHGEIYTIETTPTHKKYNDIDDELRLVKTSLDLSTPAQQKIWYKQYAKKHLPDLLHYLADECHCTYSKIIIRDQKTKRGTCSANKNIGLNRRLVKMPINIQEYIIYHELAHLTHLNHSQKFWSLVEEYCPTYLEAEKWMKKYGVSLQ